MGLACVSIYSSIVNASTPDGFLRCTLVYLLGMQIGNALGVQAVGIAEWFGFGPIPTASIVAVLPVAIAVFVLFARRTAERRPAVRPSAPRKDDPDMFGIREVVDPKERRRLWEALQPQECLFDLGPSGSASLVASDRNRTFSSRSGTERPSGCWP
jgi:hypothetical protein